MKIRHVFCFVIVLVFLYLMTGDSKKVDAANISLDEIVNREYEFQDEEIMIVDSTALDSSNEKMQEEFQKVKKIIIQQENTYLNERNLACLKNAVSITIPSNITEISMELAQYLPNLEQIIVDPDNKVYSSVNGVLYNKSKEKLLLYPHSAKADVIVNDGTKVIGERAFYQAAIQSIVIPDSLVAIEEKAFAQTKLTTISLPTNFRILSSDSFEDSLLENVIISQSNPSLCSIDGVIYTKDKTLIYYWPEEKIVQDLIFPETLTYLDCKKIPHFTDAKTIKIPKAMTAILNTVDNHLESITMDGSQPYFKLEDGVLYSSNYKKIRLYPNNNKDTEITLHKDLTVFPMELFRTENTTQVLTLPANLCELKGNRTSSQVLLSGFSHLKELKIDKSNQQFKLVDGILYNTDLTKLLWYPIDLAKSKFAIPESVTLVDNDQLVIQNNLEELTIPKDCNIYDLESFNRSDFFFVYAITVGKECPKLKVVNVDKDSKKYCSIDGVLFTKDMKGLLLYPAQKQDKTYSIPEGVQSAVFFNENAYLVTLTLSKSLNSFNIIGFMESEGTIYGDSLLKYSALKEINVQDGNTNFQSLDGVLYGYNYTWLIAYPMAKETAELELPSNLYGITNFNYLIQQSYLKKIYISHESYGLYIEDGKLKSSDYYGDDLDFGDLEFDYKED